MYLLVDSYDFKEYWLRNTNRQEEIEKLADQLAIDKLRDLVLGGHDVENMSVRELRNLAIRWHMKYYTKLPKENLRAELMRIRDEKERNS